MENIKAEPSNHWWGSYTSAPMARKTEGTRKNGNLKPFAKEILKMIYSKTAKLDTAPHELLSALRRTDGAILPEEHKKIFEYMIQRGDIPKLRDILEAHQNGGHITLANGKTKKRKCNKWEKTFMEALIQDFNKGLPAIQKLDQKKDEEAKVTDQLIHENGLQKLLLLEAYKKIADLEAENRHLREPCFDATSPCSSSDWPYDCQLAETEDKNEFVKDLEQGSWQGVLDKFIREDLLKAN